MGTCCGFPVLGDQFSGVPIHPQHLGDMLLFSCLVWEVRADPVCSSKQGDNFIMINYCRDIAFADDTNLISRPVQDLTGLLHSVESRAAEDSLGAAASKCRHMRVNGSSSTGQQLRTQNGELVPVVTPQVRLGSLITNNQQIIEELGKQVGYCRCYHEVASGLLETCHDSLEA